MQLRHLAFVLATALALGAPGCALLGGAREPSIEERLAYDEAVALIASDPAEAGELLESFLQTHRESPLAQDAALRLADLAQDRGDRSRAIFWLSWLVANHPAGSQSDAARVELARLSRQAGDLDTARESLVAIRYRRLSPDRKQMAYRLQAELAEDDVDQLRWLSLARSTAVRAAVADESLELMDAEIQGVVDGFSTLELLRASEQLGDDVPAGRVALRLAQRSLEVGDLERASDGIDDARDLGLAPSDVVLLEELALRLELLESGLREEEQLPEFADVAREPAPSTEGAVGTLGVAVPLEGPYASYGEEVLRGVLVAAGVFDGSAPEPVASLRSEPGGLEFRPGGVRVLVRDVSGDPARAAAAVHDLAQHEDVVAVVGPLRSKPSEAAARAAENAGIPLLALTTREEVPRDRPHVFRLRTTPQDEIRYLIDYAFEVLGARRFAALYPDDGYGRGMRDEFWRLVEAHGGWVVAAAGYDPESTDFAEPIRRMIGYTLLTPREQRALVEREAFVRRGRRLDSELHPLVVDVARTMIGPEGDPLPPIVDFDALFIPDSHDKIVLIAPQLAFHELTGVQLLGPGEWNHPDLVEIGREHVAGAVISTPFDPASRFPFVTDFVERYREAFGEEPGPIAAHAFDAAHLVLVQLAAGEITRETVRDGILRTRDYPGASGLMSVRADGNARKRPFLLQVQRGRILPLD